MRPVEMPTSMPLFGGVSGTSAWEKTAGQTDLRHITGITSARWPGSTLEISSETLLQ